MEQFKSETSSIFAETLALVGEVETLFTDIVRGGFFDSPQTPPSPETVETHTRGMTFDELFSDTYDGGTFFRMLAEEKVARTLFPEIAMFYVAIRVLIDEGYALSALAHERFGSDAADPLEGIYNVSKEAPLLYHVKETIIWVEVLAKLLRDYEKRYHARLTTDAVIDTRAIREGIERYENTHYIADYRMRYGYIPVTVIDDADALSLATFGEETLPFLETLLAEHKRAIFHLVNDAPLHAIEKELLEGVPTYARKAEEAARAKETYAKPHAPETFLSPEWEDDPSILHDYLYVLYSFINDRPNVRFDDVTARVATTGEAPDIFAIASVPPSMREAAFKNFFRCLASYIRYYLHLLRTDDMLVRQEGLSFIMHRLKEIDEHHIRGNLAAYGFLLGVSVDFSDIALWIEYYTKVANKMGFHTRYLSTRAKDKPHISYL